MAENFFNTSVVVLADGTIQSSYRKIHLFDVDVEGHKPVRESDVFAGGTQPEILTIKGWKIGSSICYDMRFSELYSKYAVADVDVILIPSAFLVPTGKAHWGSFNSSASNRITGVCFGIRSGRSAYGCRRRKRARPTVTR